MSDIYIYSTLSNDQDYVNYDTSKSGVPGVISTTRIQGQANLMNKNFVTPRGAVTKVTAEQYAELRRNETFMLHKENGFILVEAKKADADQVAADMTGRDQSAPLVEQDDIQAPTAEEDKSSLKKK